MRKPRAYIIVFATLAIFWAFLLSGERLFLFLPRSFWGLSVLTVMGLVGLVLAWIFIERDSRSAGAGSAWAEGTLLLIPVVLGAWMPLTMTGPAAGDVQLNIVAGNRVHMPTQGLRLAARVDKSVHPGLVFLQQDSAGEFHLRLADPFSDPLEAAWLTAGPDGIRDFAAAPDGETIAYSRLDDDGSTDIYLINLAGGHQWRLLDCREAACTGPVWSPDGERLIYERRSIKGEAETPGLPRLFWLEIPGGQTDPVFSDPEVTGLGPSFSLDGSHIALVVPDEERIMTVDLETGVIISWPSSTGEKPVWGEEGTLYFNEVDLRNERFAVHLYRYNFEKDDLLDLSGPGAQVNDGSARYHPPTGQLLFTRNAARTSAGKQVWLIGEPGSEPVQLTNDFEFNFGAPSWSPAGDWIAVQRFQLADAQSEPSIWIIHAVTGEQRRVSEHGSMPVWLP